MSVNCSCCYKTQTQSDGWTCFGIHSTCPKRTICEPQVIIYFTFCLRQKPGRTVMFIKFVQFLNIDIRYQRHTIINGEFCITITAPSLNMTYQYATTVHQYVCKTNKSFVRPQDYVLAYLPLMWSPTYIFYFVCREPVFLWFCVLRRSSKRFTLELFTGFYIVTVFYICIIILIRHPHSCTYNEYCLQTIISNTDVLLAK